MRSELAFKFRNPKFIRRIVCERLTEPMHLNLLAALVAISGTYRARIAFDLVNRPCNAFGLLRAADRARELGLRSVTVVEFGVASGAGLLNLCQISERVRNTTGVEFEIVGFDSGRGLPAGKDYRDHPELYQGGDYPMDQDRLIKALPRNARLVLGPLAQTVPEFMRTMSPESPLGFVSLDVDYYSSARDALVLLTDPNPRKYLPLPALYADDIPFENHCDWRGELLAINEFNAEQPMRKIERDRFLPTRRIFKNGAWLGQMFLLHVLDHPQFQAPKSRPPNVLPNLVLR